VSARVAVVIPWFGRALRGGAEEFAWQEATRLARRGHAVEVLATCGAAFQADWAVDHHPPGPSEEDGVTVRRFRLRRRDRAAFDEANRRLLAVPKAMLRPGVSPVDGATADAFVRENVHAPGLLEHLERHGAGYDAVLFLPYLYGPTLLGVERVAERAWLQPCLHDEAYAYLPQVAALVARARGLLFNSSGEAELAARLYGPAVWAKGVVVGGGVESAEGAGDPAAAGAALAAAGPRFLLYLGRRDPTKNVDLLVRAFAALHAARPEETLRLVLAGPGPLAVGPLPPGAVDLGLVDEAAKRALLAGCLALVQPSRNESYSRVMMEAWTAGRPVLAHRDCAATAEPVAASGGGLLAGDEAEWTAALARLADAAPEQLAAWGEAGRAWARERADWERAVDRLERALGLVPQVATAAPPLRVTAVHQMLPTLVPGDAIGNHARRLRAWLRGRGLRSEIVSVHCDPRLEAERVRFHPGILRPDEGLIYHHSIGSELTPDAVGHRGPKLLVYHNVTPPEFFAPYRPEFAPLLAQGREELSKLAAAFPESVGDSRWNADELAAAGFRAPGVLPIAVDPEVWDEPADPEWMARLQDGAPNLLFVGRIAPNKRQEHAIGLLAHLLAHEPRARLVLAGPEGPDDPYASCLRGLAARLGVADRVWLTGELTPARLQACYRTAHLFLSCSEHEGFGVPLVEAMWFDVPVLAYRSTAVPETLGEAGLLYTEKRWSELAVLAARLLRDGALRSRVLAAQRRRREAFRFAALAPAYEAVLGRVFGAGAAA
jgi:glycosyltransferase involved in cell wall biosynthesis